VGGVTPSTRSPSQLGDLGTGQRAALLQRRSHARYGRPVPAHQSAHLADNPLTVRAASLDVSARAVQVDAPGLLPKRLMAA
jgi:hypothetical protein